MKADRSVPITSADEGVRIAGIQTEPSGYAACGGLKSDGNKLADEGVRIAGAFTPPGLGRIET